MTLFVYSDQKKELTNYFLRSDIINRFFMETVISFYIDIEFAGSGMFFTKFQYRHECQKIFQRFWALKGYREQVRNQMSSAIFERFLNCLINDMTYCLEEGLVKMEKIKVFEARQDQEPGHISKEDTDNNNQDRSICRANFQLAGECIWIVLQLSEWCKEIFKNEAFAERIANTLNFVLKHLVGPEMVRVQIKDPESVSFKQIKLLVELCTIYTNL